jgi:hypothetical protein
MAKTISTNYYERMSGFFLLSTFTQTVTLAVAALLTFAIPSWAANAPADLVSANFRVLDSSGTEVIGHSKYVLEPGKDGLLIGRGEARFKDGEYDIEYDTLIPRTQQPPRMLTMDHRFYNADGSKQREIAANFVTGQTTCTQYQNGVAETGRATLDFTPDSYGGSAVLLPLRQYLAQGQNEPLKLHALNCIPGPRLIAVKAQVQKPSEWSHYPGRTVEVDIKPDLGWLNAVIGPLLPQIRAWFDPSRNWLFVGGQFSRYYRGPRIMLVTQRPPSIVKGNKESTG